MFKFLKLESGVIVNLCNIIYIINEGDVDKNGKINYIIYLNNNDQLYCTSKDIKKILSCDFYNNKSINIL